MPTEFHAAELPLWCAVVPRPERVASEAVIVARLAGRAAAARPRSRLIDVLALLLSGGMDLAAAGVAEVNLESQVGQTPADP